MMAIGATTQPGSGDCGFTMVFRNAESAKYSQFAFLFLRFKEAAEELKLENVIKKDPDMNRYFNDPKGGWVTFKDVGPESTMTPGRLCQEAEIRYRVLCIKPGMGDGLRAKRVRNPQNDLYDKHKFFA